MEENRLWDVAATPSRPRASPAPSAGQLPVELVGDLGAVASASPLWPCAPRVSSRTRSSAPFAGVYVTKMIPNNQLEPEARFHKLVAAMKLVWASTFFRQRARLPRDVDAGQRQEKMAVIMQEVVGRRHGERYYPEISGVARSYSFYRFGRHRPEDGVVLLALGLGKTIVDGEPPGPIRPPTPRRPPPFASIGDLLKADADRVLGGEHGKAARLRSRCARPSTSFEVPSWTPRRTRFCGYRVHLERRLGPSRHGLGVPRPRRRSISRRCSSTRNSPSTTCSGRCSRPCRESLGRPGGDRVRRDVRVPSGSRPGRFGFLQVRPMAVSREVVDLDVKRRDPAGELLLASDHVMGNGVVEDIQDVVYRLARPLRCAPHAARSRPRSARGTATLVADGQAVRAHRVRALGQRGSVAGRPGRVGGCRRREGPRRGHAPER